MKEWHFFDKVYRVWVVLIIGDHEELIKFMEKIGYNDLDELEKRDSSGMSIVLCDDNNTMGNRAHIVWLKKYETACLVHELSHLVMAIFDDKGVPKGVPIRNENTETFAYYQEFWFNEIQRVRRRLPNGRKPSQVRKEA